MEKSLSALLQWAQQRLNNPNITLQPLPEDASQRRYYRVENDDKGLVAVDTSAETGEIPAFIAIAAALQRLDLQVPDIYAVDLSKGFLLVSDFGDQVLLYQLNTKDVNNYYQWAYQDLLKMQTLSQLSDYRIPDYDITLIQREWEVFTHWFLQRYKNIKVSQHTPLLESLFHLLATNMHAQPQVFIHRDYHSRNLMVLPNKQLGILDFQGARIGSITYDLVSLLKDCYINWPSVQIEHWALQMYPLLWQQANLSVISPEQFLYYFDLTGLQRHLKVLGQFTRKLLLEKKPSYMQDMPRVQQYVMEVCGRYQELSEFKQFLLDIGF